MPAPPLYPAPGPLFQDAQRLFAGGPQRSILFPQSGSASRRISSSGASPGKKPGRDDKEQAGEGALWFTAAGIVLFFLGAYGLGWAMIVGGSISAGLALSQKRDQRKWPALAAFLLGLCFTGGLLVFVASYST